MSKVLFLRAVTPLHVGTGQSAGYIDLEIAREKATHWPVVPGSSVKGVMKDAAKWDWIDLNTGAEGDVSKLALKADKALTSVFGYTDPDTPEATSAGALMVSDMRIVLFPVRSIYGTFAYVACPLSLRRTSEFLAAAGKAGLPVPSLPGATEGAIACVVDTGTALRSGKGLLYLEDLDLTPTQQDLSALANALAGPTGLDPADLKSRLAVVDETGFSFLVDTATEVVTHVTLEFGTKTAKKTGLRVEESVPAEAVFAGLAAFQRTAQDGIAAAEEQVDGLDGKHLQFGGKGSTGKGLCRLGVVK